MRLTRIEHGVFAVLAVLAAYIISGGKDITIMTVLALSTLFAECFLFTTNDIYNIHEDRINRPNAPLVKGTLSIGVAKLLAIIFLSLTFTPIIVSIVTNILNVLPLLVLSLAVILGFLYNVKFKKMLIINNLILSLVTSLVFLYGASATYFKMNILIITLLFLTSITATMGREVVKGIIDVNGDKVAGIKTIATMYGVETACKVSLILTSISIVLSIPLIVMLTYLTYGVVLIVGIIVTCTILTYGMYLMVKNVDNAEKFRKISLTGMAITITSFFLFSILSFS